MNIKSSKPFSQKVHIAFIHVNHFDIINHVFKLVLKFFEVNYDIIVLVSHLNRFRV